MLNVTVDVKDSPKFYVGFRDIYGETLRIPTSDVIEIKYSVAKLVNGQAYPLEEYADVEVPSTCWHEEPASYPTTIQGVGASSKDSGYNLEVFPYRNVDGEWESPFSEQNTAYQVTFTVAYFMEDSALEGSALFRRNLSVKVTTSAG